MHIPDGFLNAPTAATMGGLSIAGLGVALRQARLTLPARRVPLLGLAAAFVFAAQMINFPVAGGTSGHMIGGVLVAALLGPSAAVVVISAVLIVQCFLFADGGVTALGANIFNMALITGVGGWAIYYPLSRAFKGLFGRVLAATFAAWCATVAASIACAGELAASGTVNGSIVLPAMAGVHMIIGIGEGVMTALVIAAIGKTRPELLDLTDAPPRREGAGALVPFGLLISIGLAMFVAPFACSWPDGLDKAAQTIGFATKVIETPLAAAPAPDYQMPGVPGETMATALAGLAGTIVVFALAWGLASVLVPKSPPQTAREAVTHK